MTIFENIIDLAATHEPETDAIKHNRRDVVANNLEDEYEVAMNFMEDPNINWSFTIDDDFVHDDSGVDEVTSHVDGEMNVPHTGETVRPTNKLYYDPEHPRLALDMIFRDHGEFRAAIIKYSIDNNTAFRDGWEVQEGYNTYVVKTESEQCSCRV
ncbi:hypothetical protein ACFE04_030057 [Oxalis oulophora]